MDRSTQQLDTDNREVFKGSDSRALAGTDGTKTLSKSKQGRRQLGNIKHFSLWRCRSPCFGITRLLVDDIKRKRIARQENHLRGKSSSSLLNFPLLYAGVDIRKTH